jgi:hypothetical protein
MSLARDRLKSKTSSRTPRLLAQAPWLVGVVAALLMFGYYASAVSRDEPRMKQPLRGPELPLEPPVELLEVSNSGLPCDIERVLKAKCRRCHTIPPRHGAPIALFTWEQIHAQREGESVHATMLRAVKQDFMPFRTPANPPVERLTAAERGTLIEWLEAGAPRGSCP